ncbi:hypothetical protein BO71DRAFT_413699 [Aspergillus ellipticus CBS 707.79]|uniref:Zn(2)-C6 fungal-type domain-containing protein n=1 Tax=Aspergillus ellipticus CBS 707.79 TaxID=1448320 RepID=A0A319D3A9_9EURO|nr:hypothetical protein BO71DRAFT_413699 [Aspergillus ellipticus CBS 707.79]
MPRHGRLSKGCQVCRKRKIKCDQALPSCSQCSKAGWKCPQYADSVERMFLHPTTKDCYRPSTLELPNSASILESKEIATDGVKNLRQFRVKIPTEIVQPVKCRAIDFFLQTHTFHESGVIRGHYEYLPAFSHDIMTDKRIVTSLTAVALAAYAYKFRYADVLKEARRQYVYSLEHMKRTLESPNKATEDGTLISVMLLNTFEGLTCESKAALSNREAHLKGAMTIIGLRGRELVQSRRGLQLFRQTSLCLTLSCLIQSLRIPAGLLNLHRCSAGYMDTNQAAWKVSDAMIKLASFRADIKERVLYDPGGIIKAAEAIDVELITLDDDMTREMPFRIVEVQKSELVLETYYHVYPDLWAAAAWNHVRACRIVLHREIKKQLESVLEASRFSLAGTLQHQQSVMTLQHLTSEICATIPQYCDHLSILSNDLPYCEDAKLQENVNIQPDNASGIPTTAGIYQFFWPLLNAGQVTQSDQQRRWIINKCRFMGRMSGIQQAFVLAEILEDGEGVMC